MNNIGIRNAVKTTNPFEVILGAAVVIAGGLSVFAAAVVLRGFILSKLWGWFIVSALGAPAINIGEALGISLVATFLNGPRDADNKASAFLSPFVALAFGYVLHAFFGVG